MKYSLSRYTRIGIAILGALVSVVGLSGSASAQTWYTVQFGDTLSKIAFDHFQTVDCLAIANNIPDPNSIYVGQLLYIPPSYSDCSRYSSMGLPTYVPYYYMPVYYPRPTYGCYYRVAPGDNLFRIALRYRTSYWSLAAANRIANPNLLYVGQLLFVPGCN